MSKAFRKRDIFKLLWQWARGELCTCHTRIGDPGHLAGYDGCDKPERGWWS